MSQSRCNKCSSRTSSSMLHLNPLHHCSASKYFLGSFDEFFRDVTVPINFNSFINEITMYVDEYIIVRSIILSTLSYQTLVIRTSFIVQQLIKTSSTRLDQFDFMRCLMISTSFRFLLLLRLLHGKKNMIGERPALSSVQDQINLSVFVLLFVL